MATATSLASYLIYWGSKEKNKLNTLFLSAVSSYENQDIKIFETEEKEKLIKFKSLFIKWNEIFKKSQELRELIDMKIKEFFKLISETEISLFSWYKENIEVIQKILDLFQQQFTYHSEKINKQSELGKVRYAKDLFNKLISGIEEVKKPFESFIQEIEKDPFKNQNTETSSQGGAVMVGVQVKQLEIN